MPHLQYWQVHLIVCNMTNQNLFVDSLSDRAVRYWTKSQCSAFKPKCACNKSHLWYRGYEWSLIGKMESLGGHFFFFPHTRMHKAAIFQAAHLRPTSTFLGAPPNHYGIVMYTIDPEKQLWVIIYDHIFLCVCVCEKWLRGCRGESFSRRVGLVLMTAPLPLPPQGMIIWTAFYLGSLHAWERRRAPPRRLPAWGFLHSTMKERDLLTKRRWLNPVSSF